MRTASSGRAFPVVLCVIVLAIAVASTYSIAGRATAAKNIDGAITVPLPECDVAAQIDADGFCRFTGTDIQHIGQTGEPSIPYQSVRVLLPPDADLTTVKATITGCRWAVIDGDYDIQPVPPLAVGDGEQASAGWPADGNIVNGKDADIYESDALFPLEPIRKVDIQVMRGWKMVQILYAPYAYNPVEKRIFQLSGDAIEITFERDLLKSSAAGADFTGAGQVREMTANFAEAAGEYGGYAVSPAIGRYVIITTDNIETASGSLLDFVASKEARGFMVQVATEETWGGGTGNTAAENIRSWLQDNYLSLSIKYVLLIGNPNPTTGDVPMKICYPLDELASPSYDVPTDFYYAELTSNWDTDNDGRYGEYYDDFSGDPPRAAEVAVGRIPYYGSIADLDNILSKIVAYENAPAGSTSWRKNALLPMKPSDGSTPGYQLGEEITDNILIPNSWTYHRVYDDDYLLDPLPETMPCTVTNVTSAWNYSDFGAVFWWTHGSATSADSVMDLSHAATLDDVHPAFTFQSSCSNGTPEASNNLGYSLLKNGCVSTVSASRVSWYRPGQGGAEDPVFAGTATNSGMTFEYAKRLIAEEMCAGDALNDLKFDISLGFEELWMNYLDFNLYGCPAVGPFTSTPDQAAPSVVTYYPGSVTTNSVRLRGNLTALGTADNVAVSFEWGTASGIYGNETTAEVKTSTGTFYFNLTGITPGTTYYYRAKATGNGITFGLEKSFSTLTTPPSVTTSIASSITATTAELNGNLAWLGTASTVNVSFEWGLTTDYGNVTTSEPMTAAGAFSANLTGLTAKTTYHFRAKAVGHGTVRGDDNAFTTSTIPPSVTTNDATNLATTSATLNGSLTSMGTATSVTVSFDWGMTPGGPYTAIAAGVKYGIGTFTANLTGLAPGTTYYYIATADGDGDPTYGLEKPFTTGTTPPSVTTGDPSDIVVDGARLNGTLTERGTAENVTVSFQWSTTSEHYDYETAPEVKSTIGTFYFDLGGLASGTTFYYRAKAVGHGEPQFGDEKTFTTGTTSPSVTTDTASDVTTTSATLNGNLIAKGTAGSVTVSFLWGTAADGPYPNATPDQSKDNTGAFSADLSGLTPGTTYYYRAKAVGDGSDEGDQMSFTTLAAPTVTTNHASNLATTSATLNGNLTALGTADNVTVSFEWKASGGSYAPIAVGVMDSIGTFSVDLASLTPGTTYYFKAKADGDGDPVDGEEESFTTLRVPLIANVSPGLGGSGQSMLVGISGSNFTGATGVGFGPEIIVDGFTLVSDTQISAAIRILCDGTLGVSDVSVTTPGGTATLIKGFAITDSPPNQPQNVAPVDKASVMTLTPTLSSSAFSHPCLSRAHTASQWQVTTVSGDYSNPLFDSAADSVNLTSMALPRGVMGEHELYWWRVRYQDSRGIWSDWSTETSFARPDFIRAELSGSAEIRARDLSSRVTGSVDGESKEGIPYSDYFSDTVTVVSPTDSYRYEVVGTEDGSYTLTVVRLVGNQSIAFHATGIPVSAGEVHQYVVDWNALSRGKNGVTIKIDSDGNGTFDKTVLANDEIGGNEFLAAMNRHQTPVWVWICLGLGLLAASSGVFVLSRVAGKKPHADVLPQ